MSYILSLPPLFFFVNLLHQVKIDEMEKSRFSLQCSEWVIPYVNDHASRAEQSTVLKSKHQ